MKTALQRRCSCSASANGRIGIHVVRATLQQSAIRAPLAVDLESTAPTINQFNSKNPFQGKVLSIQRLGGRNRERDVCHIVIDTGGVRFDEGQAFGVIPPGHKLNSRGKEVPHGVRLYSIASSRYGDKGDGKTCTLCVVRVRYYDPITKQDVPEKKGLCSNYLCDSKPGDVLNMTGPAGSIMLMPRDPHANIVCVSTGTGIAPFRSFWRRLFYDGLPGTGGYKGHFWLMSGFANDDSVLYGKELKAVVERFPERARFDCVLSLQQKNTKGEPMYVQDCIEANADEFIRRMTDGKTAFYFCGLKRMYSSVHSLLHHLCTERGLDSEALIEQLKHEGRWHVEVA